MFAEGGGSSDPEPTGRAPSWLTQYPFVAEMLQQEDEALDYQPRTQTGLHEEEPADDA